MKYLFTGVFIAIIVLVMVYSSLHIAYPLKYKNEIEYAATAYNVDKVLIASIIYAESGFKPNATSQKGAQGLMQVMPATAQYLSQKVDTNLGNENLYDPQTNIMMGTCYLRYLLNRFIDTKTVLIAYNAGEGNASTWLKDGQHSATVNGRQVLVSSPFPQTNAYVDKVFNAQKFYEHRF